MKRYTIIKEDAGVRLDKFLVSALAEQEGFFLMSRGEIIRQLKDGKVLVNGKVEKPSYIIEEGDQLEIGLVESKKELAANEKIVLRVIHEDENLIVVDKPAGLQVHPGHLNEKDTLVNWLVAKYPEIAEIHDESEGAWMRPGIVHRLDKDTSGVMVIARNKKALLGLKKLFHDRKVEKTYIALAEGVFDEKDGTIDKPIARATSFRKQVVARKNTKTIVREAVTQYKILAENREISLVELKPKTGRMHQIRVHLSSIGHPIIGDKLYGAKKIPRDSVKRQMLHALRLKLEYQGQKLEFFSAIPEDMLEAGASIDGLAEMNYAEKAL